MEILRCENCGFEKPIPKPEMEEYEDCKCMLCNGDMVMCKEDKYNETEGIDQVINKQLIDRLVLDIKQKGEPLVWDFINKLKLDTRIAYLELFFEAKKILKQQSGETLC